MISVIDEENNLLVGMSGTRKRKLPKIPKSHLKDGGEKARQVSLRTNLGSLPAGTNLIDDEINCICNSCEWAKINKCSFKEHKTEETHCSRYIWSKFALERVRKRVQDRQKELKEQNTNEDLKEYWNTIIQERLETLVWLAGEEEK